MFLEVYCRFLYFSCVVVFVRLPDSKLRPSFPLNFSSFLLLLPFSDYHLFISPDHLKLTDDYFIGKRKKNSKLYWGKHLCINLRAIGQIYLCKRCIEICFIVQLQPQLNPQIACLNKRFETYDHWNIFFPCMKDPGRMSLALDTGVRRLGSKPWLLHVPCDFLVSEISFYFCYIQTRLDQWFKTHGQQRIRQ